MKKNDRPAGTGRASKRAGAGKAAAPPQFARDKLHGFTAIASEFYELQRAVVTREGQEREKAEALDVAITAMRFYMGEYQKPASQAHTGAIGVVDSYVYGKHGFGPETGRQVAL